MLQDILLLSAFTTILADLDFAIHLVGGGKAADRVAARHNMLNLGEIIEDSGFFLLRTVENARHRRSLANLTSVFAGEEEVDWAEFQAGKERVKRDPIYARDPYSHKAFGRRLVDNLFPRKVRRKYNCK